MADEQFEVVFPESSQAVVLLRCADDPDPAFEMRGRTKCYRCLEWCWLGTGTFELVVQATALPLCHQCSIGMVTPDTLIGMVIDHCNCGACRCA